MKYKQNTILGCRDEAAYNYDETADYDDGNQCEYNAGCTLENATNYDENAQYDDGSCEFQDLGDFQTPLDALYLPYCADPNANNFQTPAT